MPLPPGFDPSTRPDLYRLVQHRDKTTSFVLRNRPHKLPKAYPPAPPELLAELAQRCPIPAVIPAKAREVAKKAMQPTYWTARGCKHHGSPALRYTSAGNCVACDKDLAKERSAMNQQIKFSRMTPRDLLPKTRTDALFERTKRYFTGEPCSAGHIAERYTRTKQCLACLAEYQGRAYVLPPLSTELPSDVAPLPAKPLVQFKDEGPALEYAVDPSPPPQKMLTPIQAEPDPFLADLDRQLGLTGLAPQKVDKA